MWKLFKAREQTDKQSIDQSQESCFRQLKAQLDAKLKYLTKMFQQNELFFEHYSNPNAAEESLGLTFQELIATLEGLITMVQQLSIEYQGVRQRLQQHEQMKHMLANHHKIVQAIEENSNAQISRLYQEKTTTENTLKQTLDALNQDRQALQKRNSEFAQQLQQQEHLNQQLNRQIETLQRENKQRAQLYNHLESKYQAMANLRLPTNRKNINFQHLQLDYIFYYAKLREPLVSFLSITDFSRLQQCSKFYYHTLKKMQSKHYYTCFKKTFEKKQSTKARAVKAYEKVYELFSTQNIKNSAFKYLYFKLKPATYMLPYLQDETPTEGNKNKNQPPEVKEKGPQSFSWRGLFASQKLIPKGEKRQQAKFSLSNLRNEEQFKKVEAKMESLFRNILPLKMPQDLRYFRDTTERQLQELKTEISQIKGQNSQVEWTAQIFCLARYMYYEINQLYNLLLVIFGDLISKNKQIASLREDYEYLRDNEVVLRNLIQNISRDKSMIEKKLVTMDNDLLKSTLQRQAIASSYERTKHDLVVLAKELAELKIEHDVCKSTIQKFKEDNTKIENKLDNIREQITLLDNMPQRSRNSSFASASSSERAEQAGEQPRQEAK